MAAQENNTQEISEILEERGSNYGDFSGVATIAQALKEIIHNDVDFIYTNWNSLSPVQKESLEMIASKMGRILNGDPNYADSWIDIAGYAKLVADELQGE